MAGYRKLQFSGEPPLKELLDDPVTRAVMACDGVGRAELDALIDDVQHRLDAAKVTAIIRPGRVPYPSKESLASFCAKN